ncbi:a-factor receptor [Kalmusia sp. IMI 367209]|nr:a-factor receptor [Kalmusia sp. IMI 367209]
MSSNTPSNTTEDSYPLYPQAVALPILAFPAWILCILPMVWHFSQRNIAAGSLILWMIVLNFFNSINPIIWPNDNMANWWNGEGLCDIEVHVQVGAVVALAACTAVIARRLANVMDTSNITMVSSQRSVLIEKLLEIGFCWVYPIIMMITYYIVQPFRYFLFGISGCVAAFSSSWPSLVVVWMWGCITTLVAAFYAGLLAFRLYHYRREFHRLIAARNTTKSRFMRLFLMALVVVILLLPYSFFILYQLASTIVTSYSWSSVHGPDWNTVVKVPSYGVVRFDRWGEVAAGYILFILFGTGTDANNTYKRMLCCIGLGKIFPSLYVIRESGSATPSGNTFGKRLTSSWSSKAKSLFSKSGSIAETSHIESFTSSTVHPVSTNDNDPILPPRQGNEKASTKKSLMRGLIGRRPANRSILPIYSEATSHEISSLDKSPTESVPSGVYARAWTANNTAVNKSEGTGVQVIHEVHQTRQDIGKEKQTEQDAWA